MCVCVCVCVCVFIVAHIFNTSRNTKVQVGNDHEKARSERNSPSKYRGGKKNYRKLTIQVRNLQPSEQLFPKTVNLCLITVDF